MASSSMSHVLLFNSDFARNEEAPISDKIVAHIPSSASSSSSSSSSSSVSLLLGVAEASSRFPSNFFNESSSASIVRVETRRYTAFVYPLPNPDSLFTLAMFYTKGVSSASECSKSSDIPKRRVGRSSSLANRLCELVYEQLVFKLGSLQTQFERSENRDETKASIKVLLTRIVSGVLLSRDQEIGLHALELWSGGMRYLALDQLSFLSTHSLLSRVREMCHQGGLKDVKLVFFSLSSLIWSDLRPKDTRTLLIYLQERCSEAFKAKLFDEKASTSASINPFGGHRGTFVTTGTEEERNFIDYGDVDDEINTSCTVYLSRSDDVNKEEVQLLVYCALQTVLCVVVQKDRCCGLDGSLLTSLDALLGPKMAQINSDLSPLAARSSSEILRSKSDMSLDGVQSRPCDDTCFFYVNEANLATRANFSSLSADLQRLVIDVSTMLDRTESEPSDVYVKCSNDLWIVGRKAFGRRVLLSLSKECANLTDAGAECSRVMETHFKNIFLNT